MNIRWLGASERNTVRTSLHCLIYFFLSRIYCVFCGLVLRAFQSRLTFSSSALWYHPPRIRSLVADAQ